MRPLTPQKIFLVSGALCAVLFAAVVLSLRMGAYPISISNIVKTLVDGALGRREEIPSE